MDASERVKIGSAACAPTLCSVRGSIVHCSVFVLHFSAVSIQH